MTNTIQRRQLFQWIGSNIKHKPTTEEGAKEYIDALQNSIQGGLWFTVSNLERDKVHYLEERKPITMICVTDNKFNEIKWSSKDLNPYSSRLW